MPKTEEMQVLFRRVFGHPLKELTPPQVLESLKMGNKDVVCCLYWDSRMPDHQLVLHRLTPDERVIFYNPYHECPDGPVGTILPEPERRIEAGGLESVSFDVFRTFFTHRQAICFSTEKPA